LRDPDLPVRTPIRETGDNLRPEHLMDELRRSGHKFTEENVVAIMRTPEGKLVWLETGSESAGLAHILQKSNQYAAQGISQTQIPQFISETIKNGKIIGYQGSSLTRPIYEVAYNNSLYRVAITVSDNGFIIGANPRSLPR
ncbi:hypothetical protein LJC34_08090, partial [Oscillospiraceae bacterium OttesenSCG-928-G22]|nr:hypothetical protein [Oscillospiraceae bacterium OttesenSCG-928-G22]